MAVLVVHFLEAMQIQHYQPERQSITSGSIQFLFKPFTKKSAIVKSRQRIGDAFNCSTFSSSYSRTMGTRNKPADVSTSISAVFSATCRPR